MWTFHVSSGSKVTPNILTRALEGAYYAPPVFFSNISKMAGRSTAKFRVPAHKLRIHVVCKVRLPRSKGQVTRSGQSQMCTPGPASNLEDRVVGTVLVRMFSNFHDEILEWIPTECIFRIFSI